MNVTFYNTKSDPRKLNKTLSQLGSLTYTVKDESSAINPVLKFNYDNFKSAVGGASNFATVNFMYIEEFKRYYWITDVKVLTGGQVEVHGHVDVLMSYKSQINNVKALVNRSSVYGNKYLVDDRIRTLNYDSYSIKTFPKGFSNSLEYVLTVCG